MYKRQNLDCFIKKEKLFLRYVNTNTSIEVEYKKEFLDEFKQKYKRMFGFLLDKELILESIKVEWIKRSDLIKRKKINKKLEFLKEKEIFINSAWKKAKVYKVGVGEVKGPALILQDTSTILLDEASEAKINEYGDVEILVNSLKL